MFSSSTPLRRVRTAVTMVVASLAAAVPVVLVTSTAPAYADSVQTMTNTLPASLYFSDAVSAGSSAYIFGGVNQSNGSPTNQVLRFNFSTETVTTLTSTLPSARFCAAAVWTGSVAYIFGGKSATNTALNTILRFDPSTGNVTTMPTTLPTGRFCMAAVWSGTRAYLFGGEDMSGSAYSNILEYNPSAGTVTAVTSLFNNQPTTGMSAVWTGSSALMFGGYTPGAGDINRVSEYIPGGTPTLKASLPSTRRRTSAVWDATSNSAFIFGGYRDGSGYLNEIDKFSPTPNTHQVKSLTLPTARAFMSSAISGRRAYLFGGENNGTRYDSIVRYDANESPVALFNAAMNDHQVSVNASNSYDPDGNVSSYRWNWGDGSADTTTISPTSSHTYPTAGTYRVTLTVTDNSGVTGTTYQDATTANYSPIAQFTTSVSSRTVSVNSSGSSDPDGTITSSSWNWGDGQTSGGAAPTPHTYTAPGNYVVTLTVTDNMGASHSAQHSVSAAQSNPNACFTATPTSVRLDVNGACTTDPENDAITTYSWSWGDGQTSTGLTAQHTYPCTGSNQQYLVRLTVTDAHGATGFYERYVLLGNSDADGDSLVRCREELQGTTDTDSDFDNDGLNDLVDGDWWDDVIPTIDRGAIFCNASRTLCQYPNPTRRNLYVEVDWLAGHALDTTERDVVVQQFAQSPINQDGSATNDVEFVLDTGYLGGGGSVIPFEEWTNFRDDFAGYKAANFADARVGIFRYGVVACRSEASPGAWGEAESPGDDFVIYDCEANMNDAEAQAREIMHEMGHTILGVHIWEPGCAGAREPNGNLYSARHNAGLSHFHAAEQIDCNGDGAFNDVSAHPIASAGDPGDVMYSGGPTGKPTTSYSAQTWAALRLDFGINGTVLNDNCTGTVGTATGALPETVREALLPEIRKALTDVERLSSPSCTY